jgi:protein-tyrosine-phosphatase
MQDVGVDLASERPRSSDGLHGSDYDLVIVLRPRDGAESPTLSGALETMSWSFEDPSALPAENVDARTRTYRRLPDELRTRVGLFVNATTEGLPEPSAAAGRGADDSTSEPS